ncbi:TolC family protein [Stieleria sp. ICT_E10.1]|uniref:TolC family protein n=1 Tax=Stieleria sedimenti TaxID=2976331 RepID=UPI00217FF0E6|nr:TolC family protein [Stieleria sedimenti]MCS7468505.1 TolC family protein [Stieleria sedimenti]
MPPDDPAAHRYMHCAGGVSGFRHWHADGDAPSIESDIWLDFVSTNDDGEIELSSDRAFELGLVHSRSFQSELENVYLTALALTLERFEFDVQWFGGTATEYRNGGRLTADGKRDEVASNAFLGFTRSFAAGGELLVNFANTFVWEFTGGKNTFAVSNLTIDLIQPLLRGAFRDIRLENLTQAERNVLYAIRDFARYRKQFYFDIVSGDQGYLDLLLKLQAIRNLEENLEALQQNLLAHEALAEAGIVTPLQVDQVFQSYQAGRLALIRARNALDNSLDAYKIRLGIPPEYPIALDDVPLNRFELTSPAVRQLESEINELLDAVRSAGPELDASGRQSGYQRLAEHLAEMHSELDLVAGELQRWEQGEPRQTDPTETGSRSSRDRRLMRDRMEELRRETIRLQTKIDRALTGGEIADLLSLEPLLRLASNLVSDLYVIQTQVRTYLVELKTVEVSQIDAVRLALDRRLDVMNRQAMVVDSWRKVRVAKDALQADLDVFVGADIGTVGDSTNPIDFSAKASSYRVGVSLDGPLNRRFERNQYRAELINYQRTRRDLIGLQDVVVQAVRRDLRTLDAEKLNFEISRHSLVAAARQVEQARVQLLAPDQSGDSSTTQDALNALSSLLSAKNSLIASWVAYETARMQLLLDIESLDLDQYGQIGDDVRANTPPAREALPRPDNAG